jgi:hypothetical protein
VFQRRQWQHGYCLALIAVAAFPARASAGHSVTDDKATFMTLTLKAPTGAGSSGVSLVDQGLVPVLQAAVTGLESKQPYVLALADQPDGTGVQERLSGFSTNPTGSAIVNAIGPIRQIVQNGPDERRYPTILSGIAGETGVPVQVEMP